MKGKHIEFVVGIAVGAALFSGGTAYAAGLLAEPSSQTFYVDGQQVQLQAYAIGGNNYVKLRDVGQAVNFNVTYDAATNSVQIATNEPYSEDAPAPAVTAPTPSAPAQSGYTISADHWSREDFSRQANPAVFTGVYDRELYNAIRQTLVDVGTENSAGDRCAYTMVSKNDYGEVKRMVGRMDGLLRYEHYVPQNLTNYYEYLDYYALSAQMPETYQAAYDFIQPVIDTVNRMDTDSEKVKYTDLQEYVRQYGAFVESWYPFGGRGHTSDSFDHAVIKAIAQAHGKTSAQVILRWHLQAGYIVIPGSSNPEHIAENFDVFDFSLSDEEMEKITALETGVRYENW